MITLTTGMLDGDPLAELGPSVGGELALAEFDQQPLVGMDGDAAAGGRGGAARPQRAGRAGLGGEADVPPSWNGITIWLGQISPWRQVSATSSTSTQGRAVHGKARFVDWIIDRDAPG